MRHRGFCISLSITLLALPFATALVKDDQMAEAEIVTLYGQVGIDEQGDYVLIEQETGDLIPLGTEGGLSDRLGDPAVITGRWLEDAEGNRVFEKATLRVMAPGPVRPQPEVGKPMPDFALQHVTHWRLPTASLQDFRGKWLVLDFWAAFCLPCMKSFPKINSLQEQFKDRIQFVLVGKYGKYAGSDLQETKEMYEKLRERWGLNLVAAYDEDGALSSQQLGIWSVPFYIYIDDEGIVRAMGQGENLTEERLQSLLDQGDLPADPSPRGLHSEFDPSELILVDGNGGENSNFLLRSVLAPSSSPPYAARMEAQQLDGKSTFQVAGVGLSMLYRYAYAGQPVIGGIDDPLYGEMYPELVLEIDDPSPFMVDGESTEGRFAYSVSVGGGEEMDKRQLMEKMQSDLKIYFGYDVEIEARPIPYWALVTLTEQSQNNLRSSGGDSAYPVATYAGFTLENAPVQMLLSIIHSYHGHKGLPFVDETGIDHNVDVTVDALMPEFDEVREALRAVGLDLVKKKRSMSAIVIRDPVAG